MLPPTVPQFAADAPLAGQGGARKTAARTSSPDQVHRVTAQPAFVLHSYPHKETSLIIDVFSRDHGRVALVAKGAKRPHSRLRGVLQTFQPLSISWSGKSEIRTLTDAEWVGGLLPLEKSALLCGFYLNELLIKLLARDDPHPVLFERYVQALTQLAHDQPAAIVLRKFELSLLKETGVAPNLGQCTGNNQVVEPQGLYAVDPESGVRLARDGDGGPQVAGQTLLDMEQQSKLLMRFLLAHHLDGLRLNTRQILIDLMQL